VWLVFEEVESCRISPERVKRVGCKMSAGKSVQAVFFYSLTVTVCVFILETLDVECA